MKQHERELLIFKIRSGNTHINIENQKFIVKPPTIDQCIEACEIYDESYKQAYIDEIMSEDEMLEWMFEQDLWTPHDDKKIESIKKDIEKLKVEIYNARNDKKKASQIRLYIRAIEKQLINYVNKKNSYMQNTREGIATADKISWLIKNTTYKDNILYDFAQVSLSYIIDEWQSSFLADSISRDLARNEPWKSLWTIRDNAKIKLFMNEENSELTYNQKNLIIWSQMYDNIQESMDCPSKDVIEDDDMLDGWFIIQAQKREKENAEKEVDGLVKNEKIKNASEVFVVAQSDEHAEQINKANSVHSMMIKKQRENFIKQAGIVQDHNLPDQRLQIQMDQTNAFRNKVRGGR
jgi:hypothetical protein